LIVDPADYSAVQRAIVILRSGFDSESVLINQLSIRVSARESKESESVGAILVALVATVAFPALAFAQQCGDQPPIYDQALKGDIDSEVEFFRGFTDIRKKLEAARNDTFNKYPRADKTEVDLYFFYAYCALVSDIDYLKSEQKWRHISEFERALADLSAPLSTRERELLNAREREFRSRIPLPNDEDDSDFIIAPRGPTCFEIGGRRVCRRGGPTDGHAGRDAPSLTPAQSSGDIQKLFPWPPPTPSTHHRIRLSQVAGNLTTWGQAADQIERILQQAQIESWGYYLVADGFAITSRIEQIDETTGAPLAGMRRWSSEAEPRVALATFLGGLFTFRRPVGTYRTFVFVVTTDPVVSAPVPDEAELFRIAQTWAPRGAPSLPEKLQQWPLNDGYQLIVLIYEFDHVDSGRSHIHTPGRWSYDTHIRSAGIVLGP
jgi:hypothetical protein